MESLAGEIWDAARSLGLSPHPVHFETVPYHVLYEVAAYGLPNHYQHWTFGRNYWVQKTRYEHGEGRIYELVINSDPAYAYILQNNNEVQKTLVMAHVMGHSHVFKCNEYWKDTRKDMPGYMAAASARFATYEQVYGFHAMEELITRGLAVQAHSLDEEHEPVMERRPVENRTPYDELFDLDLALGKRALTDSEKAAREKMEKIRPGAWNRLPRPTGDILGYIVRYSPQLLDYQRDVLSVIRQEGIYFQPYYRTRLLHEGFAVWTHQKILDMLDMSQDERMEAALTHASVTLPSPLGINPYHFGWKMLEMVEKERGSAEVIKIANEETDSSFIRAYLDERMVEELDVYKWIKKDTASHELWEVGEKDWRMVRDYLAESYARPPYPGIEVRREVPGQGSLVLAQVGEEDMDEKYARETLNYCQDLWGHRVELQCRVDSRSKLLWSHMTNH
ncbi:MAG: SpoVR family protein [Peptococcaceae bacterium]|jgi:stage V sporulation protein R|nr:SpoVR family protein [Peptococcaceae bacterium]